MMDSENDHLITMEMEDILSNHQEDEIPDIDAQQLLQALTMDRNDGIPHDTDDLVTNVVQSSVTIPDSPKYASITTTSQILENEDISNSNISLNNMPVNDRRTSRMEGPFPSSLNVIEIDKATLDIRYPEKWQWSQVKLWLERKSLTDLISELQALDDGSGIDGERLLHLTVKDVLNVNDEQLIQRFLRYKDAPISVDLHQ